MPYPDNYSPDAQDRFMGRNSRADEARADADRDADHLWDLSAQIEQAIDLLADIETDAKALAHLIDLPDGKPLLPAIHAIRLSLGPIDVAVTEAHRRAEGMR